MKASKTGKQFQTQVGRRVGCSARGHSIFFKQASANPTIGDMGSIFAEALVKQASAGITSRATRTPCQSARQSSQQGETSRVFSRCEAECVTQKNSSPANGDEWSRVLGS